MQSDQINSRMAVGYLAVIREYLLKGLSFSFAVIYYCIIYPKAAVAQTAFIKRVKIPDSLFIFLIVNLRDNLPDGLQCDFKELQEYYNAGDWFMFDTFFEAVEASVKAYYLAGKISREDLDCIFRKYGMG